LKNNGIKSKLLPVRVEKANRFSAYSECFNLIPPNAPHFAPKGDVTFGLTKDIALE